LGEREGGSMVDLFGWLISFFLLIALLVLVTYQVFFFFFLRVAMNFSFQIFNIDLLF